VASTRERAAAVALGAAPLIALGLADGGFYPRPWGWAAFFLACAVVLATVGRRELAVSPRPLALLALLAGLGAWIAASLLWTQSGSLSALELERLLVYLTGVGAAVLLVRRDSGRYLLAGVLAGTSTVSTFGLVTYLLAREQEPDVLQGSFLHRPMGYANAMAIVTVIAILLALGTASSSRVPAIRVGLALPLVPLAAALTLTGNRTAVGALLAGGAVAFSVAVDRRRTATVWATLLVVPVAGFVLVSSTELTSSSVTGSAAGRLGDRTLAAILALTALTAVPALLVGAARVFRTPSRRVRVVLVFLVGLTVMAGLTTRAPDLAGDRPTYWRVALDEFAESPLLGSGAGTFTQVWLERRPNAVSVRDAHSLPVEALSELGIIGLALVVMLLAAPLVWAVRRRDHPLMPAAAGAYAAFAAHAVVDWDWELPAVTLAGLFCATGIAALADEGARMISLRTAPRALTAAAGASAAVVAVAVFLGASAMESASRALARGDAPAAERAARRAERLQPWSVEPLLMQGRAQLATGERLAAQIQFVRAINREPDDYRAWLALAAVTDGEVAEAAVQRARTLNPRSVSDLSRS
jgi:O-antigen ligase